MPVRELLCQLCVGGCGLFAAAPVAVAWSCPWTVCGRGQCVSVSCPGPVRARGIAAFVDVSDSHRLPFMRMHRDCFADLETFGTKG
jgi:hypothetical protein